MNQLEQHRARTEESLRHLESAGFDVKSLWRELSEKIDREESGKPTEDDLRYLLPATQPLLTEHFVEGKNPVLEAGRLWEGYSYELSAGQRALLRESYGMTPTRTVTLGWIERWKGTQHPRDMLIKSDVHVDNERRKHVLTSCVIRGVGTFLRLAAEMDAQEQAGKVASSLVAESLTLGRVLTLDTYDRWAIEDLSGVKLGRKVEVMYLREDSVNFMDLFNGKIAKIASVTALLDTVREYESLHREASPAKRGKPNPASNDKILTSLDDLIKSLL